MFLQLEIDHYGRLIASLSEGAKSATATASDPIEAAADLAGALDAVQQSGLGESYWLESQGEYRWLFRRSGDRVRIVVLWSAGVVTGWEHVFETECDLSALVRQATAELQKVQTVKA